MVSLPSSLGAAKISYPLFFTAGVTAGLLWLIASETQPASSPRQQHKHNPVLAGVIMLGVGLFAARIIFVLLHSTYYFAHPLEILTFWQGGLSGIGGFVGALAGLCIYALLTDGSLAAYADALAIPGAIVASSCWLGCWMDGCAYGIPLVGRSLLLTGTDMFDSGIPRWPTQASGAIFSVFAIGILFICKDRIPQGILGMISISLIALGIFGTSFFRGDPSLLIADLRVDLLSALALTLLGISGILIGMRKREIK